MVENLVQHDFGLYTAPKEHLEYGYPILLYFCACVPIKSFGLKLEHCKPHVIQ